MPLRPRQARWFETYVPHGDTVRVIELLAGTGCVQLEHDPRLESPVDTGKLNHFVACYRTLAAPFAADLPAAERHPSALRGDAAHLANLAVHRLRVWTARLDYLKEHLAELEAEQAQLDLLAECLAGMRAGGLTWDGVFRDTGLLCKCLFACPADTPVDPVAQAAVGRVVRGAAHEFLYVAAMSANQPVIEALVVERGCEQLAIPHWLDCPLDEGEALLAAARARGTEAIRARTAELDRLKSDPDIALAQANMATLAWYLEHAAAHLGSRDYCHVTGWTTDAELDRLQGVLRQAGIQAIIRSPEPPGGMQVPVALADDWWSRPFQPMVRLWGTPGRVTVDPSGTLALVVPLLFGYMFPDIGHGAVLALIALAAWRRHPGLRFLLPCGLAAMAFGWVFGDLFGFHGQVAPLWAPALGQPLPVLAVPLLFGAGLMLLGLVFNAIEAYWNARLREWWLVDAALLTLYASALVGALLTPWAFALTGVAVLHYFLGRARLAGAGWPAALPVALSELLMSSFDLVMNTLSFARVGAFALAHAALSSAIATLAATVEHPAAWLAVVVLGNVFSIAVEGLLVFVQTTRLVLFEFFMRFMHAEGRPFNAVRPPPA